MNAILGLDLGMASLGFCLMDTENESIMAMGAHIFEAAENAKDGASLAEPRRRARGGRRRTRRRRKRLRDLKQRLLNSGFHGMDRLFDGCPEQTPWQLRKECLSRELSDAELGRVLYHIAKHRGFQSNRKDRFEGEAKTQEEKKSKKEKKKMLAGAAALRKSVSDNNQETVGAYLAGCSKQRNLPEKYEHTITRDLLREEVTLIFERQRSFGQAKATQGLLDTYCALAFTQLPIQSSISLVGQCELEPEEKRAPRRAYTAERFVALSRLFNLRIQRLGRTVGRPLEPDERDRLLALAYKQKTGVSFTRARKELKLDDEERFNLAVYRKTSSDQDDWDAIRKNAENKPLIRFPGFQDLKSAMEPLDRALWETLLSESERLDTIAYAFSFFSEEDDIRRKLEPASLPETVTVALLAAVDFTGTINLSLKVLYAILPYMARGQDYSEACASAGYHHSKKESAGLAKLGPAPTTRNPVVDRALAQARKLINAVIRRYGMPDRFHIEFSRDLGKSKKDRDREQRENEKFRERNKEARDEAAELFGGTPSGEEYVKYRLWKEQKGHCLYSGRYLSPEMLMDPLACQIDHALPRRRSWDDSFSNKVLCLSSENQRKGNRTPYEYLEPAGRWGEFLARTKALSFARRRRITIQHFDEEVGEKYKQRALNDTRYMARALKTHIETSLAPKTKGTRLVLTVNGRMTSMLRARWGLGKKERSSDLHHAVDAAIVAASTYGLVERVNEWSRDPKRSERSLENRLPMPWPTFRDDVLEALGNVFVSRQPVRKGTGRGHHDTIMSRRVGQDGSVCFVQRVALGKLTPSKLEQIVDVDVVEGAATGRNRRLYEVLERRLTAHGGDPKRAFQEPIYMPRNDPTMRGPLIRSVRIRTDAKSMLRIPGREGYAANDSMIRVDVFEKGGKFFLVPVYAFHVAKRELPDRVCTGRKCIEDWDRLDRDHHFLFSLSKNDYVVVEKRQRPLVEGYYVGMNINNASIALRPHHNQAGKIKDGIGVKTLQSITKFTVNVFGEKSRVRGEKRHGVADVADPA